jgi:hypothetical protein
MFLYISNSSSHPAKLYTTKSYLSLSVMTLPVLLSVPIHLVSSLLSFLDQPCFPSLLAVGTLQYIYIMNNVIKCKFSLIQYPVSHIII